MSAFDNATKFFHACESLDGWAGCKPFVTPGARFRAQCEPLEGIDTVEGYTEWMASLGKDVLPGCHYKLVASAYDASTRTALFFGIFTGKHTGAAGPVPATHKQAVADYVYALTMDADDKVGSMVKIWNAPWSMKELGWA
jgi:hypothetical protein